MELLKKSLALVAIVIASNLIKAQSNASVINAFSDSYTFETAAKYNDAITSITTIYDAESYEMNLRLGWLYYLAGQHTTAINYYEKAIKICPYAVEARFGYVLPASVIGNWESVKNQYLEILKIDPKNSKANFYVGMNYYNKKDYNTAYKYFEICANLYPFDYDSVMMLAWTNFQLGKLREAKVLFNKALLIRPNDKSATEGLSLIK